MITNDLASQLDTIAADVSTLETIAESGRAAASRMDVSRLHELAEVLDRIAAHIQTGMRALAPAE